MWVYQDAVAKVLGKIAKDQVFIGKLLEQMSTSPNVPSSSIGNPMCWSNVVCIDGWKLQHNWYFDNYRIVDPEDSPRIWSKDARILEAFLFLEQSDD